MMAAQAEVEVTLPIGLLDVSGHIQRQAAIHKMRGYEEALLYDESLGPAQLVSALIRSCLVRLGTLRSISPEDVSQLYTADRNYLLLQIRRISLGDQLLASYQCPRCSNDVAIVHDLAALPVRRVGEDQQPQPFVLHLEDGYVDRQGQRHLDIEFAPPRGSDEELVAPMLQTDPLKAQDAFVLHCITRFGTLPSAALEAYGVKILRDLSLADRQRIHRFLNTRLPGVDFQCAVHCDACGLTFTGVLDVTNFFVLG